MSSETTGPKTMNSNPDLNPDLNPTEDLIPGSIYEHYKGKRYKVHGAPFISLVGGGARGIRCVWTRRKSP